MRTNVLIAVAIALLVAGGYDLGSAPPPPAKAPVDRIADLIQQLGHKEFAKREAAAKELQAIGEPALDALRKTAANNDPEIRERAQKVVLAIRADLARKELAKLQGTWYTVSTDLKGTITGEDKTDTITYEGTDFIERRDGQLWAAGTIAVVDATANPKQLEYTVTEGRDKGLV